MKKDRHNLSKSGIIGEIPLACSDELAAVELFEKQRWGKAPCCIHCGSVNVYKMVDAERGERNKRFLWRCRDCGKQYTVRVGTVCEESRIGLCHWCYAFWRAATSKKGVSALEIKRQCQISYKSALFLMNRIRFAVAPGNPAAGKLAGVVECDEGYVGGRPRFKGISKRGRGTKKTPVFAAVERNGRIRRQIAADVSGKTLKAAIRQAVDKRACILTDDLPSCQGIGTEYAGGHHAVAHSTREYVRGDIHTNTAEPSFAPMKRGITGIYHSVSKEYLHRYLWQFDLLWNARRMNDGERTLAAIRAAEGRHLMYGPPHQVS
jgi:transposase-like protein